MFINPDILAKSAQLTHSWDAMYILGESEISYLQLSAKCKIKLMITQAHWLQVVGKAIIGMWWGEPPCWSRSSFRVGTKTFWLATENFLLILFQGSNFFPTFAKCLLYRHCHRRGGCWTHRRGEKSFNGPCQPFWKLLCVWTSICVCICIYIVSSLPSRKGLLRAYQWRKML